MSFLKKNYVNQSLLRQKWTARSTTPLSQIYVCQGSSVFTCVPVSISTFFTESILIQALIVVSKHRRDLF